MCIRDRPEGPKKLEQTIDLKVIELAPKFSGLSKDWKYYKDQFSDYSILVPPFLRLMKIANTHREDPELLNLNNLLNVAESKPEDIETSAGMYYVLINNVQGKARSIMRNELKAEKKNGCKVWCLFIREYEPQVVQRNMVLELEINQLPIGLETKDAVEALRIWEKAIYDYEEQTGVSKDDEWKLNRVQANWNKSALIFKKEFWIILLTPITKVVVVKIGKDY